jgi:hypothetical protein
MRLLRYSDGFHFSDHDNDPPPYAILSHTWSENNKDEVLHEDVLHGTTKDLTKLNFCKEQAAAVGLEYFWIDTCCIDKRNDAEVGYAIRSMYRWYNEAAMCFAYLSDMSIKKAEGHRLGYRKLARVAKGLSVVQAWLDTAGADRTEKYGVLCKGWTPGEQRGIIITSVRCHRHRLASFHA